MQLQIVPLDSSLHDRGAFSCGHLGVDGYLKRVAAQAQQYFKAATFVLLAPDTPTEILGFYTLVQHAYVDEKLDPITAKVLKVKGLKQIPMILLGQLGIASSFQGKGLGKMLLWDALRRSYTVATQAGGIALITDPIDDNAAKFYAKYSFQTLHTAPIHRMILPMKTIKATILASAKSP